MPLRYFDAQGAPPRAHLFTIPAFIRDTRRHDAAKAFDAFYARMRL